jgi:probable HAF family extracellular repeat protein
VVGGFEGSNQNNPAFFVQPLPHGTTGAPDGYPDYFQSTGTGDENALMQAFANPCFFGLEGSDNFAWFVNDSGQVACPKDGTWQGPGWFRQPPATLFALAGTPRGMNDAGWVCGGATRPGGRYAFVRRADGTTLNLGHLGGGQGDCFPNESALPSRHINNANLVVGTSATRASGDRRAFVWDQTRGMRNLNSLIPKIQGYLSSASLVNDAGQIAGRRLNGNTGYVYRLTRR